MGERVLIVGTGAMACLFGARLAPFAEVTMLGTWEDGLQALRRHGIRLETNGRVEQVRVQATSQVADCRDIPQALVLVKSWQTERAARQLAVCLPPDGVALTLQNGLGNLEILQDQLGAERAALGVTTTGATLLGPGRARPGGSGPTHLAAHPRLERLAELLQQAGFELQPAEDLQGLIWGKLAINAGINPLTALLEVPNGELLERPGAHQLMRAAAQETAQVAAALEVRLPYADAAEQVEMVARRTAANHSSMLQDVRRGAPTEIDAINGAIARKAERVGQPAPLNWALWNLVRAKARASEAEA